MSFYSINTANEILNAFRLCNNDPREEAKLFDSLATRPEPPVDAFIELLKDVKMESVLALTIQALGKITDASVKTDLKESNNLLEMLSQQAISGSSDLIRWSAVTAIEEIGFNFLLFAKSLPAYPRQIADRIVQARNKPNSNSSNESVNFWDYYQAFDRLRKPPHNWKIANQLTGHSNSISSLAFSPDGEILASASNDNTIKLWQVGIGKEIRTLTGHSNYVSSLAISLDGLVLVSGSLDKVIKLWQLATGTLLRNLTNEYAVFCVALSPDGLMLASGISNFTTLWQIGTGQGIRTFTGHSGRVNSVIFSPDGENLISSSHDASIKLWQLSTGNQLLNLTGHSQVVTSLAISPDGQILASGSGDSTIKLWDVNTWQEMRILTGHYHAVNSVAFSPDSQTIASASADNTIKIWQLSTGKTLRTLIGHSAAINFVVFSPDGETIASASNDGTIQIWKRD